jgi:cytochrome P450
MPKEIPTVSVLDSLRYNLGYVLPYYLRGIFTRSKFWFSFWTKVQRDPSAVKFVSHLRKKYGSKAFYIHMLATKSLLILDVNDIKRVLDRSPLVYGEAKLKRTGMSHFQPNAVTISRGEAWTERRRFNEAVLDSGHSLHRYADYFLEVIRSETAVWQKSTGPQLSWTEFEDLFEKITLQITFGKGVSDTSSTRALKRMMLESNRAVALRKSKYFDGFYKTMRNALIYPRQNSLVFRCTHVPSTDMTKVENQIPHWIFAMNDTLATNTVCALALISSHPDKEGQIRKEMDQVDLSSAQGIDQLKYLEGCVQEAMRIWPSTPLLVRETVIEDILAKRVIPAKTQVLILNTFNHRDRDTYPFADSFSPEIWLDNPLNYHFNHLSNGSQMCAGKELALFIAKTVLANLLAHSQYTLQKPPLDPNKPLPYLYNHFQIHFTKTDR